MCRASVSGFGFLQAGDRRTNLRGALSMHVVSGGIEGLDRLSVNVYQLAVVRLFRVVKKVLVPGIARRLEPCRFAHIVSLLQGNRKRLHVSRGKKQPLSVRHHLCERTVIGHDDRGPDRKRLEHRHRKIFLRQGRQD
jgi:hypothetical protein